MACEPLTCAACAFVPGETVPSDLPDGLCPLTASNKNALHAKRNIEKRPLRCAVARKGNGLFLSGFHPLFRCTHTAMRRGRRRCKIGIARSNAKTGHAESFLRFTELAAHDPRRKAGAIWAHPLSKIFAPSGQSRPCRPNRYKLAGNAASSPGGWEGSRSDCCALACLEMRWAELF